MALKKRKIPNKAGGEQLYMLEILVDRLDLRPEKIADNKGHDLTVRVGFIDLTPVDITPAEGLAEVKGGVSKRGENPFPDEYDDVDYEGKTCLFVRTPSDLIRSVKSTPLSVEVYQSVPRGTDRNARDENAASSRAALLCAATAFLPGYFCDRVATARNKVDGLSEPYASTEIYTLIDERGGARGTVTIYLRLSCFGSSIVGHLTLREKSFVFRGFPFGRKFPRASVRPSDGSDVSDGERTTSGMRRDDGALSLLREILNCACPRSRESTDALTSRPPESPPPRVTMDQSAFEGLTSAEKLNDREYRSLIYDTYPDEPTCSCLPTNRSTHPMMCRSGCARSCCTALRNPDVLKDDPPSSSARMRGGDDDDAEDNCKVLWDDTWRGNNINLKDRMKGGSDYGGATAYAPSEMTTVIYRRKDDETTGVARKCRPRNATSCVYSRKAPTSWRTRGAPGCTRKPCAGADCMIRAFKEAQEFVDSLGKVQGMVGLGLMDPSDSPYFGRDIDKDYAVVRETPSERKRGYAVSTAPNQIGKSAVVSTVSIPYATSTSVTAAAATTTIPGRTGVVREAIPSLPDATTLVPVAAKPKKKEDKRGGEERPEKQREPDVATPAPPDVEVGGPCGEPKCKSRRRRKPGGDDRTAPPTETAEEKSGAVPSSVPLTAISTAKGAGKAVDERGGRYPKGKPSPDRDAAGPPRGPVKVSKRVMRFVYSIGDVYPGTNYGHKNCINPRFRIPANMGWLWNTNATAGKLKPRIGWKPGAIGRYMYELLKEAKGATRRVTTEDNRLRSTPSRTGLRRGKVYKSSSYVLQTKKEGEEETEPPPTLHIHRKDGSYYVTMYPIRQESAAEAPQLEEPMKPLQFKIARNKDDASVATSSTASDMEIEFSPPAAIGRYRRRPDVIHVDTQVRQQEILDAFEPTADAPKKKEKRGKREKREKK